MKKTIATGLLLVPYLMAVAGPFDKAELRGVTDKDPVSYTIGEPIDFTLTLSNADVPENGAYFVQWVRTGDDGKKESGKVPVVKDLSFRIATTLEKPGFVRIEAKFVDEKGKDVKRDCPAPGENWFGERGIFFSGGAAADLSKLRQGVEEPEDFDAFWEKQKAELRRVPMKVKRWEVKSPKESVRMYGVRIDCAGGRPVTGYLSIPKRCDTGMKLPARIEFDGYGTGIQRVPKQCWFDWQINFHINAHGYELERDGDYYKRFFASIAPDGKAMPSAGKRIRIPRRRIFAAWRCAFCVHSSISSLSPSGMARRFLPKAAVRVGFRPFGPQHSIIMSRRSIHSSFGVATLARKAIGGYGLSLSRHLLPDCDITIA